MLYTLLGYSTHGTLGNLVILRDGTKTYKFGKKCNHWGDPNVHAYDFCLLGSTLQIDVVLRSKSQVEGWE